MKDVFRSCDSSKKFKIAEGQWYRYVFFQAEDGIRVLTVTGVQTCALPISRLTQFSRDPKGSATRNARRRATAHQPHRYSPSTTFIIVSHHPRGDADTMEQREPWHVTPRDGRVIIDMLPEPVPRAHQIIAWVFATFILLAATIGGAGMYIESRPTLAKLSPLNNRLDLLLIICRALLIAMAATALIAPAALIIASFTRKTSIEIGINQIVERISRGPWTSTH